MNTNKSFWLSDTGWTITIVLLSVVVVGIVALLLYVGQVTEETGAWVYIFPKLNAIINSCVSLCLITGYFLVINRHYNAHKFAMLTAFCLSILFLVSYVTYHALAPHTSFQGTGLVRTIYFTILVSHILLAIIIVPMALFTLLKAFQNKLSQHKRIARWTLPVWLYVSFTGVAIYLMISPYYPV